MTEQTEIAKGDSQQMLDLYEELFGDRYSEKDEEFMAVVETPSPPPPCVANWYSRPKRDNSGRGRGGYDRRGRGGGYDRRDNHGYDRNSGGGYQGRNSGHQRGGGGYSDYRPREDNRHNPYDRPCYSKR